LKKGCHIVEFKTRVAWTVNRLEKAKEHLV